ncbi:hypothetical protein [Streptomyces glaucescens]|uniref:Uncharacterized protein n=1 Tax=Streptomyces glaucescens TaxID=1907 RepID=A0A089XIJ0_STRGA|nr:hypothetical protein [Streptomyces glaucescens]AIS01005.1 hypothetical protein SGLAU_25335 [Streptomyces glaucescens]
MIFSRTWDWDSLETLSIPAAEIHTHLERLVGQDPDERTRAGRLLYCEVANQGHLYSAAAPCVDALTTRARTGTPLTPQSVSLLESILNARNAGVRAGLEDGSVDVTSYCRSEILAVLPQLLSHADGSDDEYFREVCYLIPQLADSSDEVVAFLRKSVSTLEGELRQAAVDALEEAEEVAEEGHMQ